MELALQESNAKYTLISKTIRDFIAIVEIDTFEYSFVVGATESITGYKPEEYITIRRTLKDSFTPEGLKFIQQKIATVIQKSAADKNFIPHSTFEIQLIHKNGSKV
jgi:hypothetical protein